MPATPCDRCPPRPREIQGPARSWRCGACGAIGAVAADMRDRPLEFVARGTVELRPRSAATKLAGFLEGANSPPGCCRFCGRSRRHDFTDAPHEKACQQKRAMALANAARDALAPRTLVEDLRSWAEGLL